MRNAMMIAVALNVFNVTNQLSYWNCVSLSDGITDNHNYMPSFCKSLAGYQSAV